MPTPVTVAPQGLDEVVIRLGLPNLMLGWMKVKVPRNLFHYADIAPPAQEVPIPLSCWNLFLPRRLPTKVTT